MSRIALFTMGTNGDVQPVVALAKALMRAGHLVRACSVDLHREKIERNGVAFACIGSSGLTQESMNATFDRMLTSANPLHQFKVVCEYTLLNAQERLSGCRAILKDTDFAICHIVDVVAMGAILEAGGPWASMRFETVGIATEQHSPMLVNFGKPLNRALWAFGQWALGLRIDPMFYRALPELESRVPGFKPFRTFSPSLNLVGVSPLLSTVPRDLPDSFVVTGHWQLEEPEYQPDEALLAFLQRHPRPAVVNFGSVAGSGMQELFDVAIDVLLERGIPIIVQNTWTGGWVKVREKQADSVLWLGYCPHSYLLPRARFLIHHAGAGTAIAACKAGIPSIAIPHNADQFHWAKRLHEIGVAPNPLPRAKLSRESLRARVAELTESSVARAREIQAELLREDGLHAAVRAVERALGDHARSPRENGTAR